MLLAVEVSLRPGKAARGALGCSRHGALRSVREARGIRAPQYLHGQQVTHRDLKVRPPSAPLCNNGGAVAYELCVALQRRGATRQLENVLLQRRGDAYLIKLTDFGLAKDLCAYCGAGVSKPARLPR